MAQSHDVSVRFFEPPAFLRRYVNTFFLNEICLPEGETVSDFLMPSWGMVTFCGRDSAARIEYPTGETFIAGRLTLTGPFGRAARMRAGSGREWGFGLLPAGWARFIPVSAKNFANRAIDGLNDPALAAFQPLAQVLFADKPDSEGELARIEAQFAELVKEPPGKDEDRIMAIFEALQENAVTKVSQLADRTGLSLRTLERICNRAYGFPPKMLLRRQRFLRSMTLHSRDPKVSWTEAMDGSYHDQSQFVREFREFMSISPSEYNAMDRPLAVPIIRERAAYVLAMSRTNGKSDR